MQQSIDVDELRKMLQGERRNSLKLLILFIALALVYLRSPWAWIPVCLEIGYIVACQVVLSTFCRRPKRP